MTLYQAPWSFQTPRCKTWSKFCASTSSSISIWNAYNGAVNITNVQVQGLNLKSSLVFAVYTNLLVDNSSFSNITQYSDYVVRIFDFHTFSNVSIVNSSFKSMEIQVIYSEISTFTVSEVEIFNISSSRSAIETSFSSAIVISNISVTQSISKDMPAFMTFTNSVVDLISSCSFTEIQYYVIELIRSQLTLFDGNNLNGINKGLHFYDSSNGTVTNSTFANFVQNIKSGDVYKSAIEDDGSAISKCLLICCRNWKLECLYRQLHVCEQYSNQRRHHPCQLILPDFVY